MRDHFLVGGLSIFLMWLVMQVAIWVGFWAETPEWCEPDRSDVVILAMSVLMGLTISLASWAVERIWRFIRG